MGTFYLLEHMNALLWILLVREIGVNTSCVYDMYVFNDDACSVMVIIKGNGHGDPSSNPGQGGLHFISW